MDEINIWDSAHQMMRLYQRGAERAAAGRADAMFGKGDLEGFTVWRRIEAAIRYLGLESQTPANP